MTEAATANEMQPVQTSTSSDAAGTAASSQAAPEAQAAASVAERPAHVPEALWDATAGSFKVDDAVKQLGELQAFKAAQDGKLASVPEKPDGYEVKLPADFKLDGDVEVQIDPNHPMVALGREVAHALKLDQPAFETLVAMHTKHEMAQQQAIAGLVEKQMEALGPKAADRTAAVKNFLTAKYGERATALLGTQLQLKEGVELLERIMRDASSGGMPGYSQTGRTGLAASAISEEDYGRMSPAERLVAARKASAR
jgi:hypothetical protein